MYSRYEEDWTWEQLVASDGRKRDLFGSSVTLNENNELVVGASGRQGGKGAVYMFKFQGKNLLATSFNRSLSSNQRHSHTTSEHQIKNSCFEIFQ